MKLKLFYFIMSWCIFESIHSQSVAIQRISSILNYACPGGVGELYRATFSPNTGLCNGAQQHFEITTSGGIISLNNSTSYSSTPDNILYIDFYVVWSSQSCQHAGSILVKVFGQDGTTLCCQQTLNEVIAGSYSPIISGTNHIVTYGQYTYTAPVACGATGYNWTYPSGWGFVSQSSNHLTISIQNTNPPPQPGLIKCSPVTPQPICASYSQLNVDFSNCLGYILGEYDPQMVDSRICTGDFDNDGLEDDIAAFYKYGTFNTTIHVWLSDGTKFIYQGDNGWWSGNSFEADKVQDIVCGDFDNDGYKDDIVATYDYGGTLNFYMWNSNGSALNSQNIWYSCSASFTPSKTKHRIVVGDFDHDHHIDDIVIMYDNYPNCNMFLWRSTGSSFMTPSIAYTNLSFDANRITGRVVSGDFNNDGWFDDVAAIYKNSNLQSTAFVWIDYTGGTFIAPSNWFNSSNYASDMIEGKLVSGDFDRDGFHDDLAGYYYYGNWETHAHVFKGNNGTFGYQGDSGWWSSNNYDDENNNRMKYRVVAGEFGQTGIMRAKRVYDIATLYDYPCYTSRIHVWKSSGTSLAYQGDLGWWAVCQDCDAGRFANPYSNPRSHEENQFGISKLTLNEVLSSGINIYPNPTSGVFTIVSNEEQVFEIYNSIGQLIIRGTTSNNKTELDLSDQPNGIYFLKVGNEMKKIIKE